MVDFNNETTVTRNAADLERTLILEKRENFLIALEQYRKTMREGANTPTGKIGSRLEALYYQMYSMIKRRFKTEDFNFLQETLHSKKEDDILKLFRILSDCLDELELTKLDTKKKVDFTNIEAANKSKGYG